MSIGEGCLIVCLFSLLFSVFWCIIPFGWLRILLATLCPLAVAIVAYWGPTLERPSYGEMRAWSWLFIAFWYAPAVIVSWVATHVLRLRIQRADARRSHPTI